MILEMMNRTKVEVAKLVQVYKNNYDQFRKGTYNETLLRVDFVNRLFKYLGWDVDNEQGLPQHLREVVHEAVVSVEEDGGTHSKKPDYSFKIGNETVFFLETKKPSVNITIDSEPAFQLRRYGWSGNLKVSVLTNFTDLYIYDCSVRPQKDDDLRVASLAHYRYTEYVEKFEEIYHMLSKESVLNGEFERQFGNLRNGLQREPFDKYFLEQVRLWRNALGEDVLHKNPDIDHETLNIFVQRILNRIIFLRICEDRCIEQYESIKSITTYRELRSLFVDADEKYDSGLFEMLEEDELSVSDDVLIGIFQNLYYPNNSYEFSVVDPYIIGQIYELFLAESLTIQNDGHIAVEEKPEIIDSNGAVNTPKGIADIIVAETLNPLYLNKSPEDVEGYRIADICCGSGNFLLSAFEYITNYYIEYFLANEKEDALQRGDISQIPGSTSYYLAYHIKRNILQKNIFGVDIDPLAVEVTKFSLLLKVFEGASLKELEGYVGRTHHRILPNIDRNIKIGNSLVDSAYARFNSDVYNDISLMNKLRIFDWDAEFASEKFDAIVGNPPYIRIQNMVHFSSEEYDFYKSEFSPYSTGKRGGIDKYYLFIEKGLNLLNENGFLGFIVPHKFMNIRSGEAIRKLLTENFSVRKIIHFGTHQVFSERSTYTCILLLSKEPNETFEIGFVQDLNRYLLEHVVDCQEFPATYITSRPWTFLSSDLEENLKQIRPHCVKLEELAHIFVGLQTSADNIYIIHADAEDENFIYSHSDSMGEFKIEKGILHKSIYDAQVSCYEKIIANSFIIFPYKEVNGKALLYSSHEMEENFPHAWTYLQNFREQLASRNMPGRTEENWFAFGRSQSIHRFIKGEHLIWPVLSVGSNYVYDNELIAFTGGGNGPFYGLEMKNTAEESIFYIQALLNHWLLELLVKNTASTFRGDFYSHGKQFVKDLPIYKINFDDPGEAERYHEIVDKVHQIMHLKEEINRAHNQVQRTILERSVAAIQNDLNKTINLLYQVEESDDYETD